MAFTFVNSNGAGASGSLGTVAVTVTGVNAGDLVAVTVKYESSTTTVTVSDGTSSLTESVAGEIFANGAGVRRFYILSSVASGTVTYTATFGANKTFRDIGVQVWTPPAGGTVSLDGTSVNNSGSSAAFASGNITTAGTDGVAFGDYGETGTALTVNSEQINSVNADRILVFGSGPRSALWAKTYTAGYTGQATASLASSAWRGGVIAFKSVASGIAFDVAANSGDQAAASSYSGSASWNGTNRMLAIDVSLLGAGVTVTAMTYGGANCTFVGSRSTVTSLGSVECWRICSSDAGAPAAGANTLAVTLSSSLEFTVEWVSYTGVHQASPTEAFNSNQATNTGSATDASVVVTTASDNCWIHAAVVANDTSISAGNTTRNNISGTLGSGANEDNNAAKTPPGAVTMSYSGMGLTTTWAIAGYAIRPIADATLSTITHFFSLMGIGT